MKTPFGNARPPLFYRRLPSRISAQNPCNRSSLRVFLPNRNNSLFPPYVSSLPDPRFNAKDVSAVSFLPTIEQTSFPFRSPPQDMADSSDRASAMDGNCPFSLKKYRMDFLFRACLFLFFISLKTTGDSEPLFSWRLSISFSLSIIGQWNLPRLIFSLHRLQCSFPPNFSVSKSMRPFLISLPSQALGLSVLPFLFCQRCS